MMVKTKQATTTAIRRELEIPVEIYDIYAERAIKAGRSVESELKRHLERTSGYAASLPIYLNDDERNALAQITGRAITSSTDLIAWATRMASLKVGEITIELNERLATRLDTRRFGKDWKTFITHIVIEALEEKVGLR